jgi:hypothetical protein
MVGEPDLIFLPAPLACVPVIALALNLTGWLAAAPLPMLVLVLLLAAAGTLLA